uniref:Uncharacterized protein n=1 Tax=Arabidopsis thaliana TaxID=3702 RepID=Q56YD8_ARATH|nr:hypothetical protein [Arabidopsis thaliana]
MKAIPMLQYVKERRFSCVAYHGPLSCYFNWSFDAFNSVQNIRVFVRFLIGEDFLPESALNGGGCCRKNL